MPVVSCGHRVLLRKKLNHVTVRVMKEELKSSIRAAFGWLKLSLNDPEVSFPSIEVVNPQCEMIAAVVREDGLRSIADQVQLLRCAEPKPGTRERECRSRNRFKTQNVPVKCAAAHDVLHVKGNVIQLENGHRADGKYNPRLLSMSVGG